jgi:type III pantothenate kinase
LDSDAWLALIIGNSRLHWALFEGEALRYSWHTPHLNLAQAARLPPAELLAAAWQDCVPQPVAARPAAGLPLWAASVVPAQLLPWRDYPALQVLEAAQIPLGNQYPGLGIDRALALVGAGCRYGWPVLVVDSGTALTLTAGANQRFWGGAILPGTALQLRALAQGTAALPTIELPVQGLPPRWADSTAGAIASGILYPQLAGLADYLTDWRRQFDDAPVVFTGGDGQRLLAALAQAAAPLAATACFDDTLGLAGLAASRRATAR